jgi:Zn-dependent alcohol dehydrogenase
MKAAILCEPNTPLIVDEVRLPERLEYGQVLMRVLVSGICGAQLQEIAGLKGNIEHMPHLLGHEGCGIVEKTGPGVSRMAVGDKCVMHWRKAAGIDAAFPWYGWNEVIGGGKVTTFNEKAVVSENRLTPVPPQTPNDLCALLGCSLSTALGTIETEAAVKFGESVLIVGVGGLGCNLIRCAKMANAYPIVAADVHESKRDLARILGADCYLDFSGNWEYHERFNVIIDTAGTNRSMEITLPFLAPSGRYIMVGQPKPGESIAMVNACHMFQGDGKTVKATQGGRFQPHLDIPRYVRLYEAGLLDLTHIITTRLPLNHINEGIDLVRTGQAGRVIIDMTI